MATPKGIRLIVLLLGILVNSAVFATHNRAGEITYKQISALTYEVTITTFTYTLGLADRDQLIINWGDNTSSILKRETNKIERLPDFYQKNVYTGRHTYPGPGVYKLFMEDPNRNEGVQNIPNSVNVVFSIQTLLIINASLGGNSTPELTNYPIGRAYLGQRYIHNPGAFDLDGDSLSYSLTISRGENGEPIDGYIFPGGPSELYVDAITGDLIWDTPKATGKYNVAIKVEEWRKGIKIGEIIRDIQIEVFEAVNDPPINAPMNNYCVMAGDTIIAFIVATDNDGQPLTMAATGGPFAVPESKARFEADSSTGGYIRSKFTWNTVCSHVRDEFYYVIIETEDLSSVGGDQIKAFDSDNFTIKVLGPPVKNLITTSYVDSIVLEWESNGCDNLLYYEIYRSTSNTIFEQDSCDNTIPAGFEKAGQTNNGSIFKYIDERNPANIQQGNEYCYLVVPVFNNGTIGRISNLACGALIQGEPSLVKVSVTNSAEQNGEISLAWLQLSQGILDTLNFTEPYYYRILRQSPGANSFSAIDSIFNILSDTTFADMGMNTISYPYYYRIDFVYTDIGTGERRTLPGGLASSSFIQLSPSDNLIGIQLLKDTPWRNLIDSIFYKTNGMEDFELLHVVEDNEIFIHEGLENGQEYTYQIVSESIYEPDSLIEYKTINISHINSATPEDDVPPCPPVLNVTTNCDSAYNSLSWFFTEQECIEDLAYYTIYYTPFEMADRQAIDTLRDGRARNYIHPPQIQLAGCYQVSATDSSGNESDRSEIVCVDTCQLYILPNVFTPNGDQINDLYTSINVNDYVKRVDMKIYNRWGRLVYETTNADINWDGRHIRSGNVVPSGVYYYVCDIYIPSLRGDLMSTLTGFIHVFSTEDAQPFSETDE